MTKINIENIIKNITNIDKNENLKKTLNNFLDFYNEQKNRLGYTYLEESTDIANIVSNDIGLGYSAIVATFLFRAYKANKINQKEIINIFSEQYGKQIIAILNGLIEVNKLDNEKVFGLNEKEFIQKNQHLSKRSKKFAQNIDKYLTEQGEYFKHFYIAMGGDIRVILLKLAYHYYKIKNIKKLDEQKRLITCREARYLYAPMAHQLSLYNIKTLLEETAMKYLDSEVYHYIAKVLAETKKSREEYIENFIKPVKKALDDLGIKAIIKGRPKSIHSIWNKMKKQQVGIDKIYDLFAIRIIITNQFNNIAEEKAACWQVYSKITDFWKPNPNRLKDWISAPKPSGYESLHTTVIGPQGKWVEVQIRTKRMDEIAEKGSAAHWKYKEVKEIIPAKNPSKKNSKEKNTEHLTWIEMLRNALENPDTETENSTNVQAELYSDILFVYTPAGELKKLSADATVLDFAYKIHSNIGNHCVGAKINGKLVGIRHKLTNGDVVEILISQKQKPRDEWLDIVVSNHAKTRIRRALKNQLYEKIENGKLKLYETIENFKDKYNKPDFDLDPKKITRLRKHFNIDKLNNFYLAIENEEIKITPELINELFIIPETLSYKNVVEQLKAQVIDQNTKTSSTDFLIIDEHMSGIKYEFAKCCNPIPGDDIFAFVSASRGTKIHKINCPNAKELISKYPYRIMKAAWKSQTTQEKFKAKIKFISEQRPGIVATISSIIAKQPFVEPYDININQTNNETYEGSIGILANGKQYVNDFINKIKSIKGILLVERIDKI
jgi:GTP pyrophosphokinase